MANKNKIHFTIVTPEKVIYQDEVDQVTIPAVDGEITILPEHTPLVTLMQAGALRVKKEGAEVLMAVSSGFVEVRQNNHLVILADTAERAENLDIERAEEGRKREEKILTEKQTLSDEDFAAVKANLEKEFARLKVARKYRSSHKEFPGPQEKN
jgi:F-type H+-transporting ATPase subunit epsilon